MKVICAWCQQEMEALPEDGAVQEVSHGLCLSCKERFFADEEQTLDRFLNKLEKPVLLVDNAGHVALANNPALDILGKQLEQVKGLPGGNVMECVNADLPEGCGNTIHCLACTIRNNVMETHETGESRKRVPASLEQSSPDGTKSIDFLISTERIDAFVLLRIDEISVRGK